MKCLPLIYIVLGSLGATAQTGSGQPADGPAPASNIITTGAVQTLTLDQCVELALQKNHKRPASQFAVAVAEAQHRQALAGYWPQITAKAGYERLSDPLNFVFGGLSLQLPAQSFSIPGGAAIVNLPANAFGPGFPPSNIQLPVSFPGQTINTPAQTYPVPQQNVKVIDQNLVMGTVDGTWLLYDGGMRKGYRQQSGGNLAMMQQEARRTDLEIVDSVRRIYWGAVLARQLHKVGSDTLERMEATLQLTETMYKGGSGKVTKADYLDNQVIVETIRAIDAELEKNETLTQAALANTMGLDWKSSVQPAAQEIPFEPYSGELEELAAKSYQFNPDWNKLEAGLRAAEGVLTTARSGYFPKLALTGELRKGWNGGYDTGFATHQNLNGWTGGVGLEIPIFDGLLTRNKMSEAQARVQEIKQTQFLLRDGLALQIKDLLLGLGAAVKTSQATLRAMTAARDNRDLNTRAYQNELVDTEKVIRAQLLEALMTAQHYKARYDHISILSQLSVVVGTEVREQLNRP
ncbi:MAG TPA: TolC family protein [Bryobacteraceae bacterium]|nr:TolC family protein [Bryobacteraceae bacterium]